jgi:uncharacterized protein (DUF1800 family)
MWAAAAAAAAVAAVMIAAGRAGGLQASAGAGLDIDSGWPEHHHHLCSPDYLDAAGVSHRTIGMHPATCSPNTAALQRQQGWLWHPPSREGV